MTSRGTPNWSKFSLPSARFTRRRWLFLAPLSRRGFTPILQRQLQFPGHLRPFTSEMHVRFALLLVRSFASPKASDVGDITRQLRLRYYDLCCLLAPSLARHCPFRRKARSPQVRTSSFPARPPDLRSLSFDHRGFVATGTLAPLGAASYPVFVHRPAVSLPASSPRLVALSQLQFASFGMVSFRGDFHPQDDVRAGRTR